MSLRISSVLTAMFGLAMIVSSTIFVSLLIVALRSDAKSNLDIKFRSVLNINENLVADILKKNKERTYALSEDFMIIKAFDDLKPGFESSSRDVLINIYRMAEGDRSKIIMRDGVELYEFMHEAHHKQIQKYMKTTFISDLMIVTLDGRIIYTYRKNYEFAENINTFSNSRDKIRKLRTVLGSLTDEKRLVSKMFREKHGGRGLLSASAIKIKGKVVGFVVTVLPMTYIESQLQDAGLMGDTGAIVLTDEIGKTLAWSGGEFTKDEKTTLSQDVLSIALIPEQASEAKLTDSTKYHLIKRRLPSPNRDYQLVLLQANSEIFRSSNSLQYELSLIGFVIVACALVIVTLVLRLVSQPLAQVTSQLIRVTERDFEDFREIRSWLFEIQKISNVVSEFRDNAVERQKLEKNLIERSVEMELLNQEMQFKNKELEQYQNHLEDRVHERTRIIEKQAKQLKNALEAEKELNNLQRSFVSMASHEFRTPLAIIDTVTQKILRRADRIEVDKLKEYSNKIRNSVKRMTGLMESTLTASRLENGKLQVSIRECDIKRLVKDCCKVQQELSPRHEIRVDVEQAPDKVMADPVALEQVITNIISNAIKYSPDEPRIDVSVNQLPHSVEIMISDHGLGIDEEDVPKMFSRYFRAKTSTGIAGTGIGLNLCKMLVEEHGGEIKLETEKGKGSTFTVCLPL